MTDYNNDENKDIGIQSSYVKQYEQNQPSNLDDSAPDLASPVSQGINKKAIAFVSIASLSVAGLAAFVFNALQEPEGAVLQQERGQIVTVPELPSSPVSQYQANGISIEEKKQKTDEGNNENHQIGLQQIQPVSESIPIVNTKSAAPVVIPSEQPSDVIDLRKGASSFSEEEVADVKHKIGTSVRILPNRDKLLLQGTYLRCVLETKIITDVSGFTSCIITEPVYSANGQNTLIPKGSKVIGQYNSSNPTGPRVGVIWDRIVTPDGVDITLRSPGVDNLGAAGHVGDFRSHWPSRFSSALLISMISDVFKYAGGKYGDSSKTITSEFGTETNPYESETADTLKQMAISQLERNNSRPNTVTINQGTLINIYTAQDIDFGSIIN